MYYPQPLTCSYTQMHMCPWALPTLHLFLMLNPLVFLMSLIRLSPEPQASEIGFRGIQRGLLDEMYGNYSLIYHLGYGNSCKLTFH